MNIFRLLPVALLLSIVAFGQCPTENLVLNYQSQVDDFSINYPGCTNMGDYSLTINGSDITDLSGLSQIEYIYRFVIENNTSLTNITGLNNIQFVLGEIINNDALTSIEGLANEPLTEVRQLKILGNQNLVNLEGLDGLTSIEELEILDNFSLVDLTGLENLDFIGGGLLSIKENENLESFNGLDNVVFQHFGGDWKLIEISENPSLTTISPNFIAPGSTIKRISITYNPSLTDLDGFLNLVYLNWYIRIWANDSLHDLSGLSNITNPTIGIIDLWENDNLENLSGLENYQTLDYNGSGSIEISENDNLTEISSIEDLQIGSLNSLAIFNNASLEVCSINSICNYLAEGGAATIYGNAVGCSNITEIEQQCVNDINLVTGNVNFDFDLDGCDTFDYTVNPLLIEITDGANLFTTLTDSLGYFARALNLEGTFEVRIVPESLPLFFEATPISEPVTFVGFGNQAQVDFCITSTETVNNLKITLLTLNDARPGFEANYQILYENVGTTVLSGAVNLIFDDIRQTFLNSIPIEETIAGNTITWTYSDLLPFQSRIIDVTFNTMPPPTNESGDVLSFEATVNPISGDENTIDNVYNLEQTIINSQDPNDKRVMQGEEIYEDEVGEYLDYIIRFQNMGTADAITVRIDDLLSSQLNWNTFRTLSTSHNYRIEILDGNQVSFIFENINLPPESSDPEGSQGFIAFQIKSKSDLNVGDFVENYATIYFDFNAAIVTNTVVTTVVENLGVSEVGLHNSVHLIPNPVLEILTVSVSKNVIFKKAIVYSLLGEVLIKSSEKNVNFSKLATGIYFVTIETDQGSVVKRIIKE